MAVILLVILQSDITIKQGIKNALSKFLTMIWLVIGGRMGHDGRMGADHRFNYFRKMFVL